MRTRVQARRTREPYWVDLWVTRSEIEAQVIRGVLDSSGIGTRLSPNPALTNLLHVEPVRIQVPRDQVSDAERVLHEARYIGNRCYRFEVIDGGLA